MRNEGKPGFSDAKAKSGMTPEEEKIFQLVHELATANNRGAENSATDPRREAERQQREGENNTPKKNSLWQNGLASIGHSLKALPFGIGAAITGAEHLYQNSKTFRYSFLATTLPIWAFPEYSWKAGKALVYNGPGGLRNILRTTKNTAVGGKFIVGATASLFFRVLVGSFFAITAGRALIDMSEGHSGALDSVANALSTTFNDYVQLGGGAARTAAPMAKEAYKMVKNTVASTPDSLDDARNTLNGAASSVNNNVKQCIDDQENCGKAVGKIVSNLFSDAVSGWAKGYGWSIKQFYGGVIPAVAESLWEHTVCNIFNCQSAPAAKPATQEENPAMTDAETHRLQRLLGGEGAPGLK